MTVKINNMTKDFKVCFLHQWSGLFSLQVKFSELTVDMFRMLQALEREPMNLASQMNKPGMQVPSPYLCHFDNTLTASAPHGMLLSNKALSVNKELPCRVA